MHFVLVLQHRLENLSVQVRILFHELWREPVKKSQHVMHDQQLTVAGQSGADRDDRNPRSFSDDRRNLRRNRFQQNRERAGRFQRLGILDQPIRRFGAAPLRLETAKSRYRLGSQADMTHDRDSGIDNRLYRFGHDCAAFELHRIGTGLLHESSGVSHSFFLADLIGQERHIADDESGRRAACHCCCMHDHHVHRNRQSPIVPVDRHPQRVATQDDIDLRLFFQQGHRIIIAGQHGDRLFLCLFVEQIGDRHFGSRHRVTPLSFF